ncbi:hypothetical protein ATZ36_18020 [Candidatus Endomicrobiellum trichonymphae]|uniref:Uncharacterized protein n=1 Tax=Endomicrobium trichonymphae TaxID=1408204 RepID=A0A1E5IK26_ENDTX|nr:hypothetical protein ATZ36_18020 [Candidatus Endomicrobium trichonymphae]
MCQNIILNQSGNENVEIIESVVDFSVFDVAEVLFFILRLSLNYPTISSYDKCRTCRNKFENAFMAEICRFLQFELIKRECGHVGKDCREYDCSHEDDDGEL